jgi:L-amino acid N-acyltransferase YncA
VWPVLAKIRDCVISAIGMAQQPRHEDLRLHIAIAGIALPNAPSLALREKLGFRRVAHFAEVGFKFGKWIDVGDWQLTL